MPPSSRASLNTYDRSVPRSSVAALFSVLAFAALSGCNTGNAHLGLLGKPAPALNLPNHPLDALRGRVVVLNFWTSWCPPCLEEFPSLAALQRQMPGVAVLAVSFDKDPQAYARFLGRHPFALRTTLDSSGRSSEAFGVTGPPETYILDRHGVVRRKFVGAQDWTSPEIVSYLRALQ
jgi:cytochrome c biogenesis protein CcmG/thiol:disulfide interchange protein DsbE